MHKRFTKLEDGDGNKIGLQQKKNAAMTGTIAVLMILVVAVSGCIGNADIGPDNAEDCTDSTACSTSLDEQPETPKEASTVEKIEVYHFHRTRQCYSCITVGKYAEETLNTFFADELESGKIVFGHINCDLPENQELVKKYGATGSSLWIGTHASDGKFSKEQNTSVWYKIGNKQEYLDYLKGVIEKKLAGDLS